MTFGQSLKKHSKVLRGGFIDCFSHRRSQLLESAVNMDRPSPHFPTKTPKPKRVHRVGSLGIL
eukprot:2038640-Amphidinium_carterae.1